MLITKGDTMKRRLIIDFEDSFIDEDTGKPQTAEDFYDTVVKASAFKHVLEDEIGQIKITKVSLGQ